MLNNESKYYLKENETEKEKGEYAEMPKLI